jgi:hypothetical protein
MRKLLSSKKGISDTLLFAVRLFVIIPILILLNIYANSFIIGKLDTSKIESEILMERFLYSPESFVYKDTALSRPYIGYIDISKFNEDATSKLIIQEYPFMSAKFTLDYRDGTKEVTYYNERHYTMYSSMSSFSSTVEKQQRKYFVKVINSTKYNYISVDNCKNAVLTIDAVIVYV